MVRHLPVADNQAETKHVESTFATRLDEGSTPSGSTSKGENTPRNTKKDTDNQTIVGVFCFSELGHITAQSGQFGDQEDVRSVVPEVDQTVVQYGSLGVPFCTGYVFLEDIFGGLWVHWLEGFITAFRVPFAPRLSGL